VRRVLLSFFGERRKEKRKNANAYLQDSLKLNRLVMLVSVKEL
jgi:hypothetical protein